jgi:DNA-binding winged helix-turn-helix (wHTH) protein
VHTTSGVVETAAVSQAVPARAAAQRPVAADFRIDGWLVQPLLNRLTRADLVVRVRPQLMDLLVCLASRPGTVLTRDELVARVWEGRWVAESAVSRCIAELRAVFADSVQRPRIIETISKRGYRLIAEVEPVRAPREGARSPVAAEAAESAGARRGLWNRLKAIVRSLTDAS